MSHWPGGGTNGGKGSGRSRHDNRRNVGENDKERARNGNSSTTREQSSSYSAKSRPSYHLSSQGNVNGKESGLWRQKSESRQRNETSLSRTGTTPATNGLDNNLRGKKQAPGKQQENFSSQSRGKFSTAGVYVTIGPQCSGKTTYLSQHDNMLDISMDNVPGTYEKVSVTAIQNYHETGKLDCLLKRVHQRYLYEYIDELQSGEQLALLLYFTGDINAKELRQHLSTCPALDSNLTTIIYTVAERVYGEGMRFSAHTVDIFIRSAMGFAVKQATNALKDAVFNHPGPVAWGNTNLSAREYKVALMAAYEAHRPVNFVVWGSDLPVLNLEQLFHRSLLRYLQTGKYVPVAVVANYLDRATALLAKLSPSEESSEILAMLAGYSWKPGGFVAPLPGGGIKRGKK